MNTSEPTAPEQLLKEAEPLVIKWFDECARKSRGVGLQGHKAVAHSWVIPDDDGQLRTAKEGPAQSLVNQLTQKVEEWFADENLLPVQIASIAVNVLGVAFMRELTVRVHMICHEGTPDD